MKKSSPFQRIENREPERVSVEDREMLKQAIDERNITIAAVNATVQFVERRIAQKYGFKQGDSFTPDGAIVRAAAPSDKGEKEPVEK